MKVSELIEKLKAFKKENGDMEILLDYWCVDCRDFHSGETFDLNITENKLELSVKHLGV